MATALSAADATQLMVRGNAYYTAKDFDRALPLYQAALGIDPGNLNALRGEANTLYQLNHKADSLKLYRQLLKAQPQDQSLATFIDKLQTQLDPGPAALPVLPPVAGKAAPSNHGDWFASMWRSALCPGWGQAYNNEGSKAWLLGGTTWALLGGVGLTYAMGAQANNDYQNAQNARDAQDRYDTAYQWYVGNQVFYVLFGTAYAYNLFDAALNADKQVSLTLVPVKHGQGAMLLAEAKW
jgi:tetratricopeptide (TPR) repeat protein